MFFLSRRETFFYNWYKIKFLVRKPYGGRAFYNSE
nr:MAG TPA: hypothetical protein [Caudoviricetes sp.]DAH52009.1 MAG TPA: hypothetical protein [Caudoviricetes sp.]DAL97426.1 MAG TPA: hypothetical protein [Caudoviricetes sp.]DAU53650.1 MAG TPA: hypothetical protein [Caudoviricetes sp.]DAW52641.1 MAG TPA: hypothetical protein [Caudoviricetes sp.]